MPGTAGAAAAHRPAGAAQQGAGRLAAGTIGRRDPDEVTGRSVPQWIDELGLRRDAAALRATPWCGWRPTSTTRTSWTPARRWPSCSSRSATACSTSTTVGSRSSTSCATLAVAAGVAGRRAPFGGRSLGAGRGRRVAARHRRRDGRCAPGGRPGERHTCRSGYGAQPGAPAPGRHRRAGDRRLSGAGGQRRPRRRGSCWASTGRSTSPSTRRRRGSLPRASAWCTCCATARPRSRRGSGRAVGARGRRRRATRRRAGRAVPASHGRERRRAAGR